jgi:hypothetical protein
MDPNACLSKIDDFLLRQEYGNEVDIWCEDLYDWLASGGFEPDWTQHNLGTSYYEIRRDFYIKKGVRVTDSEETT